MSMDDIFWSSKETMVLMNILKWDTEFIKDIMATIHYNSKETIVLINTMKMRSGV